MIHRPLLVALLLASAARSLAAQGAARPFEITDNSFLVEEAFNQDPGVVQNIFNVRIDGAHQWESTFTQEWPLFSHRHQLSYTVPYASISGAAGFGDVAIHYRLQARDGGDGGTSFSPRATLILPSGRESRGLGAGSPGWEVNLPFSRQVRDLFLHWNAGFTSFPSVKVDGAKHNLFTPRAAASAIWRIRPMVNMMFESVVEWEETAAAFSTSRTTTVTFVPGMRTGWNRGDAQGVVGVGVPVTVTADRPPGDDAVSAALFLYFSYELPFVH